MVGIQFNWTKNIGLSIESGFSTGPKNRGKNDKLYVSIAGSPFELVAEHQAQYTPFGYSVNRLNLVIRFGGQKINYDKL